ncbi:MAG: 3-dehydroquinate synthase [Verrucomicrobia bacterium]|nr:3-dehydroquinate synthase [Verrucomicrobiota bacterium]
MSLKILEKEILSDIIIQRGLLQSSYWLELLGRLSQRVVIITDDHVRDFIAHPIKEQLEKAGFDAVILSIPPGEKSKTRQVKEDLEDRMFQLGYGRDTTLIAVGGGVVTDLAGFVAATYCRGIPSVTLPTTLLGQVDASIGGKVGLNTAFGKNLIGALHHPRWVLIDPDVLTTLGQQEKRNGMAEIIKYACIASKSLFERLQEHVELDDLIYQSCKIKKNIVEQDPQERGLRRILNFGHTVGHAIEALKEYQLSHGEAVAMGMLVEAHVSWKMGYLAKEEFQALARLLHKYHFELNSLSNLSATELIRVMKRDKKAALGRIRCVLLENIGKTVEAAGEYCVAVEEHLIEEVLHVYTQN